MVYIREFEGSQNKADKALADAKNYVETNYTNQKLTVLTGSNAIQDARISGNDYKYGITFMDIGANNTTGYPLTYGFVKMKSIVIIALLSISMEMQTQLVEVMIM